MKVWTNNEFTGHWPVGTSAVVVADDIERAASLLEAALTERGLSQKVTPEEMRLLDLSVESAVVLQDGNY